jgi:hypothetical protein
MVNNQYGNRVNLANKKIYLEYVVYFNAIQHREINDLFVMS